MEKPVGVAVEVTDDVAEVEPVDDADEVADEVADAVAEVVAEVVAVVVAVDSHTPHVFGQTSRTCGLNSQNFFFAKQSASSGLLLQRSVVVTDEVGVVVALDVAVEVVVAVVVTELVAVVV